MTRVIAGRAKGRRLQVPSGLSTRPTADRAREGLFSSLLSLLEIEDAQELDLYAGSAALGLEAASRGAAGVTLVENDPHAVALLRANVALLALPGTCVVAQRSSASSRAIPHDGTTWRCSTRRTSWRSLRCSPCCTRGSPTTPWWRSSAAPEGPS